MLVSIILLLALQALPGTKPDSSAPSVNPGVDLLQQHKKLLQKYQPRYELQNPDELQNDLEWLRKHFPLRYEEIPPEHPPNPRLTKAA